jgi:molybdopterin/thiamine biosynthesis adenylyltransferase
MLSEEETGRYARQAKLFGEKGLSRIRSAQVFVAGSGGLGSAILFYLAAAGVGKIRVVDHGVVEASNLNRQILYSEDDIGTKKVIAAEERLRSLNSEVEVEVISRTIDSDNVDGLVGDSDLIVDALDNFPTRYLLNETALGKGIPLFHGAVDGFYGQATTVVPGKTACLRCLFPQGPSPTTVSVVGTTCGVIGCIQATEVIKHILGIGCSLENKLLIWDGLSCTLREIDVEKNPGCEGCQS